MEEAVQKKKKSNMQGKFTGSQLVVIGVSETENRDNREEEIISPNRRKCSQHEEGWDPLGVQKISEC